MLIMSILEKIDHIISRLNYNTPALGHAILANTESSVTIRATDTIG